MGPWFDLVLTIIGAIPELGSLIKGGVKGGLKLAEGAGAAVFAPLLRRLGDFKASDEVLEVVGDFLDHIADYRKRVSSDNIDNFAGDATKLTIPTFGRGGVRLVDDSSQEDDVMVELAGSDVRQHRRLEDLLKKLASRELDESSTLSRVDVEDRWRLGVLLALDKEEFTDDMQRLLDIDEVASLFGYPRDMKDCLYYNRSATRPFEAFRTLVSSLSARLGELGRRIANEGE